jgi:glycosyltransferase involved in cell wall biosynthesis
MGNKLVSIAMATYNGEKYLREQLDSIYNQTYKNMEVVVCDDCSTDGTAEILEKYKQEYGLKYYINEKNLGFAKNFEKATCLCKGEFIAFSDQDDIWHPEKIEILVKEIENYSLVRSDSELIDSEGKYLDGTYVKNMFKRMDIDKPDKIFPIPVQGCSYLFKREILKKALPFSKHFSHDKSIADAAECENGIKFLDKCLFKYRLHDSNVVGIQTHLSNNLRVIIFIKKMFPTLFLFYKKFIQEKIKKFFTPSLEGGVKIERAAPFTCF